MWNKCCLLDPCGLCDVVNHASVRTSHCVFQISTLRRYHTLSSFRTHCCASPVANNRRLGARRTLGWATMRSSSVGLGMGLGHFMPGCTFHYCRESNMSQLDDQPYRSSHNKENHDDGEDSSASFVASRDRCMLGRRILRCRSASVWVAFGCRSTSLRKRRNGLPVKC